MWKLSSAKVLPLTKALAAKHYAMQGVPQDRPERDRILNRLKEEFSSGRVRPCVWATCYCKETKGTYRANGKHSSKVLSELNGKFAEDACVTMEHYECDSLEDLARLYATFDYREGVRSVSDINRAFAASIPQLATVSTGVIGLAVAGMGYAQWEGHAKNQGVEKRASLMADNVSFVRWLETFMAEGGPARHLKRAAVVAAIFLSFKLGKSKCVEFWCAVRDGTDKSPEHPTRKLMRMLQETRHMPKNVGDRVSTRGMFVKCIHAWNAWVEGQPTNLKFFPLAVTPEMKRPA